MSVDFLLLLTPQLSINANHLKTECIFFPTSFAVWSLACFKSLLSLSLSLSLSLIVFIVYSILFFLSYTIYFSKLKVIVYVPQSCFFIWFPMCKDHNAMLLLDEGSLTMFQSPHVLVWFALILSNPRLAKLWMQDFYFIWLFQRNECMINHSSNKKQIVNTLLCSH